VARPPPGLLNGLVCGRVGSESAACCRGANLRLTLGGRSGRPLTHSSYSTRWDRTMSRYFGLVGRNLLSAISGLFPQTRNTMRERPGDPHPVRFANGPSGRSLRAGCSRGAGEGVAGATVRFFRPMSGTTPGRIRVRVDKARLRGQRPAPHDHATGWTDASDGCGPL